MLVHFLEIRVDEFISVHQEPIYTEMLKSRMHCNVNLKVYSLIEMKNYIYMEKPLEKQSLSRH